MSSGSTITELYEDYSDIDEYSMDIEPDIVDKLGIKLYDKVSDSIAELIANAYDADAENVRVKLPLGKYLATRKGDGTIDEKGYVLEVKDDGHGMTPMEANSLFLRVGRDRRDEQGQTSREKDRPVMGRKGIGKLAPFGICDRIEIVSAGGSPDVDEYKVSHFEMSYDDIKATPSDERYKPERGEYDGETHDKRGTIIRLKEFNVKKVPRRETFARQLGYKFATGLPDFNVVIEDTKEDGPEDEFTLEDIDIPVEEETKIDVSERPVDCDGEWKRVSGWMAMSKEPYKDEFGGVRIYVRGKLASITNDFGLGTGFTGEFVARSYLVGEVHADFLDEDEDLVQTHRKDIIWDSRLGTALQEWGKSVVKEIARKGKEPRRQKTSNEFMDASDLKGKARERYGDNTGITDTAVELGKKFGQFAHEDELEDSDYVEDFSNFVITFVAFLPSFLWHSNSSSLGRSDRHPPSFGIALMISMVLSWWRRARCASSSSSLSPRSISDNQPKSIASATVRCGGRPFSSVSSLGACVGSGILMSSCFAPRTPIPIDRMRLCGTP